MNKSVIEYTLCLTFDVTQHLWTMVVLSWGEEEEEKKEEEEKEEERERTKEKRGRRKEKIHVEEG